MYGNECDFIGTWKQKCHSPTPPRPAQRWLLLWIQYRDHYSCLFVTNSMSSFLSVASFRIRKEPANSRQVETQTIWSCIRTCVGLLRVGSGLRGGKVFRIYITPQFFWQGRNFGGIWSFSHSLALGYSPCILCAHYLVSCVVCNRFTVGSLMEFMNELIL